MIKCLAASLLLVINACTAIAQVNFISPDKHFSVAFPGTPEYNLRTIPSAFGDVNAHTYLFDGLKEPGKALYAVIWYDLPASIFTTGGKSEIDEALKRGVNGMANGVKGKLTSLNPISLHGNPGRAFRVVYKGGRGIIVARQFIVNKRFFMVEVISSPESESIASHKAFLDSFKLL